MTTTDLATKETPQQALLKAVKADLDDVTSYLETLLPGAKAVERFKRMAHLAILRNPDLLECNRKSLLLSLIWCAYKRLEPGVEDGAWLIPFKKNVVPVPAYKGIIKRAVETETVKSVQPYAVYANDDFSYHLGTDPVVVHTPPKLNDPRGRGELIGAYVVFTMADGSVRFSTPMSIEEIEKVRNAGAAWKSKPGEGPWEDWKEQMALKTAIKRGFKPIPLKEDLRDLLVEDGRLEIGDTVSRILRESGAELPEGLQGEDEPPPTQQKKGGGTKVPPKEEKLKTGEYDILVQRKMAALTDPKTKAACEDLLKRFVTATAASQTTPMSDDQLKVRAAANFEVFWNLFITNWEQGQFFGAGAPPEGGATATGEEEAKTEGPENSGKSTGQPGEGTGEEARPFTKEEAAQEPVVHAFHDRAAQVFKEILAKSVPASVSGISGFGEITPDNIDEIKLKVAEYQPPARGKRGGHK